MKRIMRITIELEVEGEGYIPHLGMPITVGSLSTFACGAFNSYNSYWNLQHGDPYNPKNVKARVRRCSVISEEK